MNSGIYSITNIKNGHRYVGSAVNIRARWAVHRSNLKGEADHHSRYLQRAWNKYGEAAFKFEVLERWEPEFLVGMEQWWINMLRPEYNMADVAGSCLGMRHSDEARANMSAAQKGSKASAVTRARQSAALKGRKRGPRSEETKAKIRLALVGRKYAPHSEETKAKISAANKGRKCSAETRANMSAAAKGRALVSDETRARLSAVGMGNTNALGNTNFLGHEHTAEAKAKIGAAGRGRKTSDETKAKQSAANKGYKHSDKARANMSTAQKSRGISKEHRAKIDAAQRKRRRLTKDNIREIRHLLSSGDISQKEIANHYPVGRGTIRKISTGQLYADW